METTTYEKIEQVIFNSGLWQKGEKSNYNFILSPDVYEINTGKKRQLEQIGESLHACLKGLGRIAAIACNPRLCHGSTWGMIASVIRGNIPEIYHDLQILRPGEMPAICKVDLMESLDGQYFIAEIDGHNKHGLGYSTLAAQIKKIIAPDKKSFPGVAATIAADLQKRQTDNLLLICAQQEAFYWRELRILESKLINLDVNACLLSEKNLFQNQSNKIDPALMEKDGKPRIILDFPHLFHNPRLNDALADLYKAKRAEFLIPPKPFFGSKALMALLRNDEQNEELEAILLSQIPAKSLNTLRLYLPPTFLVYKDRNPDRWQKLCEKDNFVIKAALSSGMKGVAFQEEPSFKESLSKAAASYYKFVLQKEIIAEPIPFRYFTEQEKIQTDAWLTRVTVHYATRQIADVIVTARRDKKVHGAPDCLQIGAILV